MTLDDLHDLFTHWKHCPPTHVVANQIDAMMTAYLGVKRDKPEAQRETTASEAESLIARYGRL
jgi:hypothetical protein